MCALQQTEKLAVAASVAPCMANFGRCSSCDAASATELLQWLLVEFTRSRRWNCKPSCSHNIAGTAFLGELPETLTEYDQSALSPNPFARAVEEQKLPPVCDTLGRIATSRDGYTCDGDDACVTALPSDFCSRLGGSPDFCYWFTAPPQDHTKTLAGHPWCVKAEDLRRYGGPIEVKCSASGPGARAVGSPTGCWWLKEYAQQDLQRLPGPIRMTSLPAGTPRDVYVDDAPGVSALSEKQAEHWVVNGSLGKLPNGGRRGASLQFI